MNDRKNIPEKVKLRLWGKAAGRCQYEGCNKPMYHDSVTKAEFNTAYLAHIYAVNIGGARYDSVLSPKLARDISNLMIMCDPHHRLIDSEQKDEHPAQRLIAMKAAHEKRMEIITSAQPGRDSHIILYGANIGVHGAPLSYHHAAATMLPERFPASTGALELGMKNCVFEDHTPDYWTFQEKQLTEMFNQQVKSLKGIHPVQHYSVFALAPMPLLIKLGTLLSDLYDADVYQKHREPATWKWQDNCDDDQLLLNRPANLSGVPVLKISLSGTVTDDRIHQVLGRECSIWEITRANPDNDFLKTKDLLSQLRKLIRSAFDQIKAVHGQQLLHLFPAMPVSASVELGRVWMPKADMAVLVYDQNNKLKNFIPTLTIQYHD